MSSPRRSSIGAFGSGRAFQTVNVFSEEPLAGNPVAVVLGAEGLSDAQMQRFTRWTNLSEATFVLPATVPDADYRVRIFTLDREMPFAGHPTLGTCHAWLAAGGVPRGGDTIIQECGAGLVPVRRSGERLAFRAPPLLRDEAVSADELTAFAALLNVSPSAVVDARWADNGPGWVLLLLDSAQAVLAVEPRAAAQGRFDVGILGPHPVDSPVAWELRTFFTTHTGEVREDPVTGSFNASAAQWLYATGRARGPYVAAQGRRLDVEGRIHVEQADDGGVWVGGVSTTVTSGTLHL